MNAEQLNAIKERAAKATLGPWKYSEQYGYLAPVIPQQHVAVICNEISRNDDAEFIATAREDVSALVAEVERLNSVKHRLNSEVEFYRKQYEGAQIQLSESEEEIERLRKALEFYANQFNYAFGAKDIREDYGNIAREALAIGEESNAL